MLFLNPGGGVVSRIAANRAATGDTDLPLVHVALGLFFLFRLDSNFFDSSLVVLLGIGPQTAFLAFFATFARISWMITEMTIVLYRNFADVTHFGPAATSQFVAALFFNERSLAFVADAQKGGRHFLFEFFPQIRLVFLFQFFARNAKMFLPVLLTDATGFFEA